MQRQQLQPSVETTDPLAETISSVQRLHEMDGVAHGTPPSASITTPVKLAAQNKQDGPWEGVALGLMLRRPRWWFKRYHFMIQNALVNIPPNWALQLMVNQEWYDKELLPYHRNLQKWIDLQGSRIVVTPLPKTLAKLKPSGVLRDRWVWEHVIADHVLVFHGEGMLCSNSYKTWPDLMHIDYVGIPWGKFNGQGGDGTAHSFRSRPAMLAAMDFHGGKFPDNAKEDSFFVTTLLKMNAKADAEKNPTTTYHIATPEESNWFGGTSNLQFPNGTLDHSVLDTWGPMLVSGTQMHLTDEARNHVLGVCPELKVIFPSLHNPHCFGARPNEALCAASLGFAPPCSRITSSSSNMTAT
jgi:hypothetical protein